MFFAQTPAWISLGRSVIEALLHRFAGQGLAPDTFSLVLVAPSAQPSVQGRAGGEGFAHHGARPLFPAGLAAAFHTVHALAAAEVARRPPAPEGFERALRDMSVFSSATAANYLIDWMTGTTGDTALEGAEYLDWASKRQRLDRFFWQMGWPEWDGCRLLQKLGDDTRFGREAQLAGAFSEGANALRPDAVARLWWELFEGGTLPLSATAQRRAQGLFLRDAGSPDALFPNYPLAGFLGGAAADGVKVWSKGYTCGWTGEPATSFVLHDTARLVARGTRPLHITFMAQGRAVAAQGPALLPALGRMIWDSCAPHLRASTAQHIST